MAARQYGSATTTATHGTIRELDKPIPEFADGKQGGWIAGIHAAVVELTDGRLMAYGTRRYD